MVRKCEITDQSIWTKLNQDFMSYEFEDNNVWEDPMEQGDPGEIFAEIIGNEDSPNSLFLVIEENVVIGFMNTSSFYSIWAHGKVLFLDDFFIREEFRGRGFGGKALADLKNLLKQDGYKRIQLFAENSNPNAVNFYRKEKFREQTIKFFCDYLT